RNSFNRLPSLNDLIQPVVTFSIGRPLNFLMQRLGNTIAYITQSLFMTYVIVCLLLGVGVYVWFRVFKQRHDLSTSLLASLLIILLPLHTVTAFMSGAIAWWLAMVLSGSAILLLNHHNRLASSLGYICSLLVLVTYESFFPLIYAGPLLSKDRLRRRHN